ncbi:hypothetical protein EAG_08885 [Camponotus floridanus]|uniref:Uncharacterized protein n=1 Tax=Camponotus floridanus TaxID=104421 RepID=E1ZWJ4_CAMFO|nr:hypothetical protein EAG_08885 [Camponotus floridanus]
MQISMSIDFSRPTFLTDSTARLKYYSDRSGCVDRIGGIVAVEYYSQRDFGIRLLKSHTRRSPRVQQKGPNSRTAYRFSTDHQTFATDRFLPLIESRRLWDKIETYLINETLLDSYVDFRGYEHKRRNRMRSFCEDRAHKERVLLSMHSNNTFRPAPNRDTKDDANGYQGTWKGLYIWILKIKQICGGLVVCMRNGKRTLEKLTVLPITIILAPESAAESALELSIFACEHCLLCKLKDANGEKDQREREKEEKVGNTFINKGIA